MSPADSARRRRARGCSIGISVSGCSGHGGPRRTLAVVCTMARNRRGGGIRPVFLHEGGGDRQYHHRGDDDGRPNVAENRRRLPG